MRHRFYALMLSLHTAACASGEVGEPKPEPEPDPGQSSDPNQPGPPSLPSRDTASGNGNPSDPLPPDDPLHRPHEMPHAEPRSPS
jgi:hypothetical protein